MSSPAFHTSFEPTDPPELLPEPTDRDDQDVASSAHVTARIGAGPEHAPASRPGVGFSGVRALSYAVRHPTLGDATARRRLFTVDLPVTADTELSYRLFPESAGLPRPVDGRFLRPEAFVAVDLEFDDGSYLSELPAVDQHGSPADPRGQGLARTTWVDQWNHRSARFGEVADGRRIVGIYLAYAGDRSQEQEPTTLRGWLDDLSIAEVPRASPARPCEWARTTRGTHASRDFSRGNNVPATAVPHGFNFWTPVTDASTVRWLYEYHRANVAATNLPALQAFAVSHQPSPWMGDRHPFQVLPSARSGEPTDDKSARALPFRHEWETDHPHYYAVRTEDGVGVEIAPTDHAAVFRFTFPSDGAGRLYFDNVTDDGGVDVDVENGVVTGFSDVRSDRSDGAGRMFVYAEIDHPVVSGGRIEGAQRPHVAGYADLAPPAGDASHVVTMRIATSLIGLDQAAHNLALEAPRGTDVEAVREAAADQWDELLGIIEVDGASPDQLTTLYSNLYRLFLYPNSGHENVGTAAEPSYAHASAVREATGPETATTTGATVTPGRVYVNNGFWDTYRTTWPAYALFTPERAAELVQGFVEQHREGGWIARWSAPGYADCMVGTSSDVAFTDVYRKGVTGFDVEAAYAAALKNATTVPPHPHVGRKGLPRSAYLGYTPTSVDEGLSWSLEGYVNDFGVAGLATALAERCAPDDPRRSRLRDEAAYFTSRSLGYARLFDHRVGFFQGRDEAGDWRRTPENYDPLDWGGDYTETDAWNMAFTVPHDGRGLATLYGGPDGLARKLDEFFATPETGDRIGDYGHRIHEMIEARDCLLGQYGHSNQPAHHICYMYAHAGQPWRTQELVRDVLDRLYVGSEIGQGYCGDEDNGEMSAWWVFSALGFYPLTVGAPEYVVGTPLFPRAVVTLPGDRRLSILAPEVSAENRYVQAMWVNDEPWHSPVLPHSVLVSGAEVRFAMGPKPSMWGTDGAAGVRPASVTADDTPPRPWTDLVDVSGVRLETTARPLEPAALFDDDAATEVTLAAGDRVVCPVRSDDPVRMYTVTSGAALADAYSWTLEGSLDGASWLELDRRDGVEFDWPGQLRPFGVTAPGTYRWYRLTFAAGSDAADVAIAELELLG